MLVPAQGMLVPKPKNAMSQREALALIKRGQGRKVPPEVVTRLFEDGLIWASKITRKLELTPEGERRLRR